MKYRILGKTGLKVSVVGLGTWQFGGEWGRTYTQDEADELFVAARDCGINLIDTAECYGDHESERLVGTAIEHDRVRWIVATKFGHMFHKPFDRSEPRRPKDVVHQVEASLTALRTDYIDLLQYHSWGDDTFYNDDVLATVHKLKQMGKVRHLGNSVGQGDNVKQIAASKNMDITAIQIIYNRLDRRPQDTTFPVCIEQNLGVLSRVPLASGYLSGKYKVGHVFDKNEVRGHWHGQQRSDAALKEVEQIQREEVPAGVPMAQWALAWCLQHPAVTCVIPGCKSGQQVRDNAAAAALDLVKADHPQAV
ncbi:MAG: aldo/keto reductase [Phycisphaeraceae bacterium]|nr:aldo/keto reductase [Phycisphaeraceae bacterium]